ncbi:MAG: FG-GAP repeat protein, partial [Planctomycetales bacterium]|nr:FG-GAP repeat protein [Planctomycetales bacterium]
MLAEPDSGIGRQLGVGDLNGDGLDEILVGGMKGASILRHSRVEVDEATYRRSVPQPPRPLADGLEPQAAAENMSVPLGFQVQLAAGEPDVHQPIAMTIDAQGRLWVAEAYTYPIRAREGEGKDKIVILSDEDQDGHFETRKIFIEGLNLVSGLEVGFGGVWVGAAPYLLFIPDANGDDVPDGAPRTLLDGFGFHDTHETLNAFNWGPDGWLYGCHGVFTHSRVGRPGTPDEDRVPINAGVWRYHPTEHRFEVFAWGSSNPWGVDFNDHGDAFITACVIPHLYHVIPGARYQRQAGQHFNPYVFDDIKTIADHLHYVGSIADHAWWGHEPLAPTDTLAAGGGHAHCGAMVYLGDNWPSSYRDRIYMNNIHGNRVNCDVLEPIGTGYVGHHGRDVLIANDRWFRGINLRTGPDGTVYLIDWYDPNACHRTNPEIWDRSNGRVYNIAYGLPERVTVNLDKCSDQELAEYQLHANDWYCRTARRVLQHRADSGDLNAGAIGTLQSILSSHEDTTRRLRALWTLWACQLVSDDQLAGLTADQDPHVRRWAIRMSVDRGPVPAAIAAWTSRCGDEQSAPVRLEMAAAAQKIDDDARWSAVEGLVAHADDADDHNQPLMVWYAVEPLVPNAPDRALALAGASRIPQVTAYINRRLASDDRLLEPLIEQLDIAVKAGNLDRAQMIVDAMVASFEGRVGMEMPRSWVAAYDSIGVLDGESRLKDQADRIAVAFGDQRIFPRLRMIVADPEAEDSRRAQALSILVQGQDRDSVGALHAALAIEARRGEVIRALAGLGDETTPARLVEIYPNLSENDKRDAINTLVTRPPYADVLLTALENQTIPRTDVHAFQVRQIVGFENESLTERLRATWGEIRNSPADRVARIEQLKELAASPMMEQASAGRGRVVFDKTCAACHKLFDLGGEVGPDITGSNRANLDYVLENVVDPSAVMGNDYRMMLIETDDGRLISGLIKRETDSALTVRTLNDTVVVAKEEIVDRRVSELSMMPEGLLDPLDEQAICDLIKYLGSPQQVAPKGLAADIDPRTGKVPGAVEGESIEIVGKTRGSAVSQPMGNFKLDRWSGNDQLWWTGAGEGDQLDVVVPLESDGTYTLEIVLTMARDYGVVQLELDGKPIGAPIDCYNTEVVNTGVLRFEGLQLEAGKRVLGIRIVGSNPKAAPAFMVGLDWARWVPAGEAAAE